MHVPVAHAGANRVSCLYIYRRGSVLIPVQAYVYVADASALIGI